MTRRAVREMLLAATTKWNKNFIWQVAYKQSDGSTSVQWFKSEKVAREWASFLDRPVIERISYTVSKCQKFGQIDDQIHVVQHSL